MMEDERKKKGYDMDYGNGTGYKMDMVLGHVYVPWQYYTHAYSPEEALVKGTLFPELYGVYKIPK